jgi:hypothetical protein
MHDGRSVHPVHFISETNLRLKVKFCVCGCLPCRFSDYFNLGAYFQFYMKAKFNLSDFSRTHAKKIGLWHKIQVWLKYTFIWKIFQKHISDCPMWYIQNVPQVRGHRRTRLFGKIWKNVKREKLLPTVAKCSRSKKHFTTAGYTTRLFHRHVNMATSP